VHGSLAASEDVEQAEQRRRQPDRLKCRRDARMRRPPEPKEELIAVEHLLETGRRRIAHVTGPPGHHSAVVRAEAFEATLAAHGAQAAGRRI
jgi:hypothetical protein